MATQRLYIVKNPTRRDVNEPDGIVKDRENVVIGKAKNREAPDGTYIDVLLENYWIITDEDKKILEKAKKITK